LAIFMAQYIYQMHGLFEMHFLAFIGSAILITYQNWKLQIPIVILVIIHHSVFGYLTDLGFSKVYFTQLDYFNLQTFLIHIFLSAVIFFISGLWAYQLKKYDRIKISQRMEMERLQSEALSAVNEQKVQLERHVAVLDKAVAQGKFEIASDVAHDIGNAVVGFGTYLTRVKRLQEEDSPLILRNLADLFETQKQALGNAIGEAKADAVIKVLAGIADTQKNNQEEISDVIAKQMSIVGNIEKILHMQRQYIEGHETQERKPVSLKNIINETLALHFVSIDSMGIAVQLDIPDELPLIKGDRTRLMQVLLTVLKNSIEAIGVQAEEKTICLRIRAEADLLVLEIRDSGSGFDGVIGSRLFELGFTTKSAGAGLALYNCRTILDSHSGTMDLTSDGPGRGALATISFKV
jgi:signal transduction histidine kinase